MRKSNNLLRDEKRLAKYCEEGNKSNDRKIQIKLVVSLCINDDITPMFRINKYDTSTKQRARQHKFEGICMTLYDLKSYIYCFLTIHPTRR